VGIDAPPIVGKLETFDVDANFDWASSIGTAWSSDAKLYKIQVDSIAQDGTIDLSSRGSIASVTYSFNSASKGGDLAVDLSAVRKADGIGVQFFSRADKIPSYPLAKSTCAFAKAIPTATLAKADPGVRTSAFLIGDGSKTAWHFTYALGGKGQDTQVDTATCK
jgi:hypothetical protein